MQPDDLVCLDTSCDRYGELHLNNLETNLVACVTRVMQSIHHDSDD